MLWKGHGREPDAKNGPNPASFCLFLVFPNKQYIFYNTSMWNMSCLSSIRHRDSHMQPLEHELSTITTRPGFPTFSQLRQILNFGEISNFLSEIQSLHPFKVSWPWLWTKFLYFCRLNNLSFLINMIFACNSLI